MMIVKNYCFAGIELQIKISKELMYPEDRFLAPFRIEKIDNPDIFTFELCETIAPPVGEFIAVKADYRIYSENNIQTYYIGSVNNSWEDAYMRVVHDGALHYVQMKKSWLNEYIGVHTVVTAIPIEHLLAEKYAVAFHCSFIEYNGKAILFTAPSETGKSTQADLWNKHRNADIINGDRAVIRLVDGALYAAGLPFAGSSTHCQNRTLPLAAIVYLAQAPVTTIRRMSGYQAFSKIWEGVSANTWDKDDMEKISAIVEKVAENIPVYYMPCTPDESAVIALEKAMNGESI